MIELNANGSFSAHFARKPNECKILHQLGWRKPKLVQDFVHPSTALVQGNDPTCLKFCFGCFQLRVTHIILLCS